MSEAKHTAVPWQVAPGKYFGDGDRACDVLAPDLSEYASAGDLVVVANYLTPANAALIVKAVNAHADLLAACEAFATAMRKGERTEWLDLINALHQTDAAIRKAKGESL